MSAQDTINAVVAQLGKAKGEILAQIQGLQDQLAAAQVEVDLSGLISAAQALDDINPDPVVEAPVEEAPVEEAPVEEAPVEDVPAEEPAE